MVNHQVKLVQRALSELVIVQTHKQMKRTHSNGCKNCSLYCSTPILL